MADEKLEPKNASDLKEVTTYLTKLWDGEEDRPEPTFLDEPWPGRELNLIGESGVKAVEFYLSFLPTLAKGLQEDGDGKGQYREQLKSACDREIQHLRSLSEDQKRELGVLLCARGLAHELHAYAVMAEKRGWGDDDEGYLFETQNGDDDVSGDDDVKQGATVFKRELNQLLPNWLIPDPLEKLIDSMLAVI